MDIIKVFNDDANELIAKREKSQTAYELKNIRSGGNEVEISVRNFFKKRLPSKYHIGHGHLIDVNKVTKNQLDIVITDNSLLPSLIKLDDNNEVFPCESVYAIGEIKSTYRKSEKQIQKHSDVLKKIKDGMVRPLIEHSCHGGNINNNTSIIDLAIPYNEECIYKNPLLSFMFFVNSGDFDSNEIKSFYHNTPYKYLPNFIIFLDKGCLFFTKQNIDFTKYPEFLPKPEGNWVFVPFLDKQNNVSPGASLLFAYFFIINHLRDTFLGEVDFSKYVNKLLSTTRNLIKTI